MTMILFSITKIMQKLCKWECFGPIRRSLPQTTLHHIPNLLRSKALAFIVFFVSMFSLFSQAQPANSRVVAGEIKPLAVGQKVPDDFWKREHLFYLNGDTIRKPLAEFKDKTLILDFWATWCGSCLKAFPEMVEFSTKSKSTLNLVPVSGQSSEKLMSFLNGKAYQNAFSFILNDKELESYFPHRYLPHVIIIANQKLIADKIIDYNEIEELLNPVSKDTIRDSLDNNDQINSLNESAL